jgi:hypothetical protein
MRAACNVAVSMLRQTLIRSPWLAGKLKSKATANPLTTNLQASKDKAKTSVHFRSQNNPSQGPRADRSKKVMQTSLLVIFPNNQKTKPCHTAYGLLA